MYLYESHLNGWFVADEYIDCYCEVCGDSDTLIGEFEDSSELCYLLIDYLAGREESIIIDRFLEEVQSSLDNDEMFADALNKMLKCMKEIAQNILSFQGGIF